MANEFRKKTLPDKREWDGFRAIAYRLDSQRVWELPIEIQDGEAERQQTTIGKIVTKLRDTEPFEVEESVVGHDLKIKLSSCEIRCTGLSFHVDLLGVWLTLHKAGANAFYARFFYYDRDSFMDYPGGHRYEFFIVFDNKIVSEKTSFSDFEDTGFDPSVFVAEDDDGTPAIWSNNRDWQQGWVCFCYRKFYSETRMGQLMVLRPDEPELYYYPEARWASTSPFVFRTLQAQLQAQLAGIRSLLTVLIVIGIVLVILARR